MRNLEKYEKNYESLPFEKTQALYRKRNILETIERYRPSSILEIGCGLDSICNYYTEFNAFTIIEPCKLFFENATYQAKENNKISVISGTLQENIKLLQSNSYDLIIMSSLLHEIPDCESLLSATAQLCTNKTIVHINVPNALSFHRLLALEMGLIQNVYEKSPVQKKMQQSHTFDLDILTKLVVKHGFKVDQKGSFFIKPFTHSQMALLQKVDIVTNKMLDGLYNLTKYFPENGSEIYMNIQLAK